jgi:hypothetical protein
MGDYTETVTDGAGNFFGIWAEGESKAGSGDVLLRKVPRNNSSLMSVVYIGVEDAFLLEIV